MRTTARLVPVGASVATRDERRLGRRGEGRQGRDGGQPFVFQTRAADARPVGAVQRLPNMVQGPPPVLLRAPRFLISSAHPWPPLTTPRPAPLPRLPSFLSSISHHAHPVPVTRPIMVSASVCSHVSRLPAPPHHLSSAHDADPSLQESYPTSTDSLLLEQPSGSHRVKYQGAGARQPFDFALETDSHAIDVSLVLPHYRARNQPYDHRLGMYVGSDSSAPIKVKVVSVPSTPRPHAAIITIP